MDIKDFIKIGDYESAGALDLETKLEYFRKRFIDYVMGTDDPVQVEYKKQTIELGPITCLSDRIRDLLGMSPQGRSALAAPTTQKKYSPTTTPQHFFIYGRVLDDVPLPKVGQVEAERPIFEDRLIIYRTAPDIPEGDRHPVPSVPRVSVNNFLINNPAIYIRCDIMAKDRLKVEVFYHKEMQGTIACAKDMLDVIKAEWKPWQAAVQNSTLGSSATSPAKQPTPKLMRALPADPSSAVGYEAPHQSGQAMDWRPILTEVAAEVKRMKQANPNKKFRGLHDLDRRQKDKVGQSWQLARDVHRIGLAAFEIEISEIFESTDDSFWAAHPVRRTFTRWAFKWT